MSCAALLAACSPSLADDRTTATRLLHDVRVVRERVTVTGYDRSRFGGWSSVGPRTTREVVLYEWAGADPYTGEALVPDGVDIDHVYPLAAAWDFGAHAWTPSQRRGFANDVARNLVPTASAVNRAKSDATPAEWLPAPRDLRCPYAVRYLEAAVAWELPVSVADWEAMADACGLG